MALPPLFWVLRTLASQAVSLLSGMLIDQCRFKCGG
jgi:hypothetical protein